MKCVLFPGRHHLLTHFQWQYLSRVTRGDTAALRDVNGQPLNLPRPPETIVWAITSANHSNTCRNPLPAHRREVAIEDFSRDLDAVSFVFHIDDLGETPRFAEYVLRKIEVDSGGRLQLTPDNCLVACSTPTVIELYERLGFRILPVELADRRSGAVRAARPWDVLMRIVAAGEQGRDWRTDPDYLAQAHAATHRLYDKYDYGRLIIDLHAEPLLGADGDLTDTRDYNTYVRSFDAGAPRKYELVRNHVMPGRIVDVGCCTGSLIRELTLDPRFNESDFFGIEVARRLYDECLHRKGQRHFASDHVFFYQRNVARERIFPVSSVNTFTTFSLTHEIESYQGRETLLRFIALLYEQLAMHGRWLNADVIGPDDGGRPVLMELVRDDGRIDDWQADLPRERLHDYLEGLSTYGRFLRFARDFRAGVDAPLAFERVENPGNSGGDGGRALVRLRLPDACEFMSKKDYTDNWQSEMHERFCFWSFADWRSAVEQAGFRVHPDSRPITNPWIVEHRYRGKVALFSDVPGEVLPAALQPLDYPPTNMFLIAEKR